MGLESHVANLSSTASGVVAGGSTDLDSDHVVDHSPSASGVVGDGNTGFVVLDDYDIHVDGFSPSDLPSLSGLPMTLNKRFRLIPTTVASTDSAYADGGTFKQHSRRTYKGPIFFPKFKKNLSLPSAS
jgi:hypothetical protein